MQVSELSLPEIQFQIQNCLARRFVYPCLANRIEFDRAKFLLSNDPAILHPYLSHEAYSVYISILGPSPTMLTSLSGVKNEWLVDNLCQNALQEALF